MKGTKKQIIILLMIGMLSMLLPNIVHAGMEIKEGSNIWKTISVTDSYRFCFDLRENNSTLGESSGLDPHLTLNKDWGAVAYLAGSDYGAVKDDTGPSVGGYTTTTGNKSGVMDFGKNFTQTASLLSSVTDSDSRRTNLVTNKDTRYVELLSTSNTAEETRGQAYAETKWLSSVTNYPATSYPVGIRRGVFGFDSWVWGSGAGGRGCPF